jgi:hypothetical protein
LKLIMKSSLIRPSMSLQTSMDQHLEGVRAALIMRRSRIPLMRKIFLLRLTVLVLQINYRYVVIYDGFRKRQILKVLHRRLIMT